MFVKNRNGSQFINIGAAARAEVQPQTVRGDKPTRFVDATGREVGVIADPIDLERLTAPIVPADGAVAVFIDASGDVVCVPIVGYRVMPAGAEALLAGPRPAGVMFTLTSGGAVVGCEDPFRQLFATLDDAKAAVMAAATAAPAPAPATPAPTPAAA